MEFLRAEQLLVAILALTFFARGFLADRNSYWNDELLSVLVHGHWNESAMDAVRFLAEHSVHPPLYQYLLYHWMTAFGTSEVATRTLSNLYITLTTLFVFLIVRSVWSRRIALTSAIVFVAMYTPFYYALETRSYAQTLFLATLSSYLLLRLARVVDDRGWSGAFLSGTGMAFALANTGLLLTHYYNGFFWAAQAIVVAVYVLWRWPAHSWLRGLTVAAGAFSLQAALFGLIWGRVLVADFGRRGGAYSLEGDARSPFELLRVAVLQPNLHSPRFVKVVGLALLVALLVAAIIRLARTRALTPETESAWTTVYLVAWLVLPLCVAYLVFQSTGVARYSSRYFMFCVVPLAPLMALVVEQGWRILRTVVLRVAGHQPRDGWVVPVAAVVIALFVMPGTQVAATATKADWRGVAQQVVDVVSRGPEGSYVLYETSFRARPMMNFYLERYSKSIRVDGTIRRLDERRGRFRILESDRPFVEEHDFLVVMFAHHRTVHFPTALAELNERYEVRHRQLNHRGRGFIVYDLRGALSHPDT